MRYSVKKLSFRAAGLALLAALACALGCAAAKCAKRVGEKCDQVARAVGIRSILSSTVHLIERRHQLISILSTVTFETLSCLSVEG
jgi:hypothetical protein